MNEFDPTLTDISSTNLFAPPTGSGAPVMMGNQIGPFKLIRLLGSGGMGNVYLAQQGEPFNRQVAVKVLKESVQTTRALDKFRKEQFAVAQMDHPGIASVYESGLTESGLPFFAMTYVDGPELLTYCDTQKLGIRARLRLFLDVCRAVRHAHQKGLIHRDIKPSNVMVKTEQGKPQPVLIDFGIARALNPDGQEIDEATYAGTPRYMSPEQAMGKMPDVRTDIYGLTHLLYRMLTGSHPFEGRTKSGLVPFMRALTNENPTAPSRAIAGDTAPSIKQAERLGMTPRILERRLQGDLDQIVLKGLARDPEDRYDSVSDLMGDITAHMEHRPIKAGKTSRLKHAAKFVIRHRVMVSLAMLVIASLVTALVISQNALKRAEVAEAEARLEAATNEQINQFLIGMFQAADAGEQGSRTMTVREALDRGAEKIEGAIPDNPLGQAMLMVTMADAYYSLSGYERAVELSKNAAFIFEKEGGTPEELAYALRRWGSALSTLARFEEAERVLKRSLDIQRENLPAGHPSILQTLTNIATVYFESQQTNEAEPILKEAMAVYETMENPNLETMTNTINMLGIVTAILHGNEPAVPHFERALKIRQEIHPGAHPDIAQSLTNLSIVYQGMDRLDEAETLLREACDQWIEILGPESNRYANALRVLASLYEKREKWDDAEATWRQAYGIYVKAYEGKPHNHTSAAAEDLADLLLKREKPREAKPFYEEALAQKELLFGADHETTVEVADKLADLLDTLGQPRAAEDLRRKYHKVTD